MYAHNSLTPKQDRPIWPESEEIMSKDNQQMVWLGKDRIKKAVKWFRKTNPDEIKAGIKASVEGAIDELPDGE